MPNICSFRPCVFDEYDDWLQCPEDYDGDLQGTSPGTCFDKVVDRPVQDKIDHARDAIYSLFQNDVPVVASKPMTLLKQDLSPEVTNARKETPAKSVVTYLDYDDEEIQAFLDELYEDAEQVATEM